MLGDAGGGIEVSLNLHSFLANDNFCRLLIFTFANSLDPEKDTNSLTL